MFNRGLPNDEAIRVLGVIVTHRVDYQVNLIILNYPENIVFTVFFTNLAYRFNMETVLFQEVRRPLSRQQAPSN